MHRKQDNSPSIPKMIGKTLVVLLAAFLLFDILTYTIRSVSGVDSGVSKADAISWCEHDYRKRDFPRLYDYLTLYRLYDPCYAVYWEAVNGYNTLVCYEQWHRAAQQGVDGAEEQAKTYYDELYERAQTPECPENTKILNGFLRQADAIS